MSKKSSKERQKKWREKQLKRGIKPLTISAHIDAHSVIKTLAKLTTDENYKNLDTTLEEFCSENQRKKTLFQRLF